MTIRIHVIHIIAGNNDDSMYKCVYKSMSVNGSDSYDQNIFARVPV